MMTFVSAVFDALGKPGPGLLNGNIHLVGGFDQCSALDLNYTYIEQEVSFGGMYCRINIDVTPVSIGLLIVVSLLLNFLYITITQ